MIETPTTKRITLMLHDLRVENERLRAEVETLTGMLSAFRALLRSDETQSVLWEAVDDVVVGVETPASLLNRKKIVDAVTSVAARRGVDPEMLERAILAAKEATDG